MFRLIGGLIFLIFVNVVAILAADFFVTGFIFEGNFVELIVAALIITIINIFVIPILKFILGPIIILTLGLFIIVINAFGLYLLDFFSSELTIQGVVPLLIATLIFSAVNIIINASARAFV